MNSARLGVNIDHVATLRQQRGEFYPEVARAAEVALANGADQITIHLREDRRHIQDTDVQLVHAVCKKFDKPLNLEMGCSDEMIKIALSHRPEWVCLVPEKRQEQTTEGGLDVLDEKNYQRIKEACLEIKSKSLDTKISLFVEADPDVLKKCLSLKADAVEIHTGKYAKDFLNNKDTAEHLNKYKVCREIIKKSGWGYNAGHGLTLLSLEPLLIDGSFEEYNIGHWIVAESLFVGLGQVTQEMVSLIQKYPVRGK